MNTLGVVSRLLALDIVGDMDGTQKKKILMLNRIGMLYNDIASVLDTSPGNVAVTISQAKKDK